MVMKMVLAVLIVLINAVAATEYYVSVDNGSDSNPGTLNEPWQHIQRAVTELVPGDVCTIRGGTYYEEVFISKLKGTSKQPITFRSYPGEFVTFEGTNGTIKGLWNTYKNNIYMLQLDYDIWQLFVDGEMQINARWPNAYWYDYSVFDYTKWGFSSSKSTYSLDGGTGVMVDNGTQNLAKSGINATGAIAILNIGQWLTWAGTVTKHTPGDSVFMYSLEPKPKAVHFVPQNCRYFLEDKLEFLDTPSEWFFDATDKKLYLWLKSSDHPNQHDISGKVSTYAFTITDSSSWITLSGLNFFATTVFIKGSKTSDVSNIRLESCQFSYPSYSKRMLGSLAVPNTTTIYYNNLLTKNAGKFVVFNCTFEYADGQTISYRGADGVFENNLWHHNDFSCVGDGDLFASEGVRDSFVRNILHSNGPSVGFSPGAGRITDRNLGMTIGSDVRLNVFYDLKYLQNDGSHIQTSIASQNGTTLEYNWCYETMKWGLRFDRVNQDTAMWGYNGTMRYNVVWRTKGIRLKGDDHHCYNNLAFDNDGYYDIYLFGCPGDGVKGENNHTITTGNILEHGACGSAKSPNCTYIPGHFDNNAVGNVRKSLRDPDNLDFRPIPNSNYISKDIGPYGKECMEHGGVYWIPGRQETGASLPIPPDATTTAKCNAHLMWLSAYNADGHDIYFGTDRSAVLFANTSSLEFKGHIKTPSNIVDPGLIHSSLYYYWRVDATVQSTIIPGQVWRFKCK